MIDIALKMGEIVLKIFFAPMIPFMRFPFLAFVIGIMFVLLFIKRVRYAKKNKIPFNYGPLVVAAILWFIYGIDEYSAQAERANIRVDLPLIVPLLYIATVSGLKQFFKSRPK